jgi:hypothetical protein
MSSITKLICSSYESFVNHEAFKKYSQTCKNFKKLDISKQFQKYLNSEYENDYLRNGNGFSKQALNGRFISFIDIAPQMIRGVYNILDTAITTLQSIKEYYSNGEYFKLIEASVIFITTIECNIIECIGMVALDILGIAAPEISRHARNIQKNYNKILSDIHNWQTKSEKRYQYFSILDLNFNASNAEITAAYKKKALIYHPDKAKPGVNNTEKMQNIIEANEFLANPANNSIFTIFFDRLKFYGNGG